MKFLFYSALACTALSFADQAHAQPARLPANAGGSGGMPKKEKEEKPAAGAEGSVQSLNNEFLKQLGNWLKEEGKQDMDPTTFYADDAMVYTQSELPFGGNYTGTEEISLFFKRLSLTLFPENEEKNEEKKDGEEKTTLPLPGTTTTPPVEEKKTEEKKEGEEKTDEKYEDMVNLCDEAKGTCVVELKTTLPLKGTDVTFDNLHVLEWNQVTKLITKHVIFNKNKQGTLDAYRTKAEQQLWEMIWTVFRAKPEELQDINSEVWANVADDMVVKLNFYPEDILTKTEYTGKQELLDLMKEKTELHNNMPAYMNMADMMKKMKFKVLHATDTEIYATVPGHAVMHYTFNEEGKLAKEEITMQGDVKPWQLYPFPAPKAKGAAISKKLKALWEQISEELKKGEESEDSDDDTEEEKQGTFFRPGQTMQPRPTPTRQQGQKPQQP